MTAGTRRDAWQSVPRRGGGQVAFDCVVGLSIIAVLWVRAIDRSAPVWESVSLAVLAVVVLAGIAMRWRYPMIAAIGVFTATLVAATLGVTYDPFIAAAWALYPVAMIRRPRAGWLPSVVLVALVLSAALMGAPTSPESWETLRYVALSAAALVGSWALGSAAGRQLEAVAEAAEARAEQFVATRQLRVAREVHDVVAHTLGTIGVEAGVARHVASLPAEELRRVLGEIEDSARSALEQVQGLVRTLRTDGEAPGEPVPGLARLPALIDRAERAGVETSLRVSGLDGWSESEEFTVLRIVQEAVTNVIRHAPGASCRVVVTGDPSVIRAEVCDDGPGRPPAVRDGHGLTGIRERARLAGGTAFIGNRAGGGFQVRVELPRSAGEEKGA